MKWSGEGEREREGGGGERERRENTYKVNVEQLQWSQSKMWLGAKLMEQEPSSLAKQGFNRGRSELFDR
jgi:hypothetical protein